MTHEELAEALQEIAPERIMEATLPLRRVRRWRGVAAAACLLLLCCGSMSLQMMTLRAGSDAAANESVADCEDEMSDGFTESAALSPAPQWLPQGYALASESYDKDSCTLSYEKEDAAPIVFFLSANDKGEVEDTVGEWVTVNGAEGLLQSGDGQLLLRWESDGYCYTLRAALSREELLRIAESVA